MATINRPPLATPILGRIRDVSRTDGLNLLLTTLGTPPAAQAPFSQTDWPNPRVVGRGQDFYAQSLLLTTLLGQDALPFRQQDWKNPTGRRQTPIDIHLDLLNTTLARPFFQTDWQNPLGRTFPSDLRTFLNAAEVHLIGKDLFFGAAGQAPVYDYPNPQPQRKITPDFVPQESLALQAGTVVAYPFSQTDWQNPRGRAFSNELRTFLNPSEVQLFGQDQFFAAAGQAPVYSYPNPQALKKVQDYQQSSQTLLYYQTIYGAPGEAPAYDYPNPAFRKPAQSYLQSSEILFFTTADKPAPPVDWPNPRGRAFPLELRTFLNASETQLIGKDTFFGAPGQVPAHDWKVPRGRPYPPILRCFDVASTYLNEGIPDPPPVTDTTLVNNPPMSGDLVDIADPLDFKLTVNSVVLDLSDESYFRADELSIGYEDGKQLVFSQISSPFPGVPSYDLNQSVALDINFGSGFKRVFSGKIRRRRHIGENNNEGVQYTAIGIQNLANEMVLKYDWLPSVVIFPSETTYITTVSTLIPVFATQIRSAITYIFSLASTELSSMGIPTTIGTPGLDGFGGFVFELMPFDNTNFVDALQQLVKLEPDKKVFWDDYQQAWTFPNVLNAPVAQIAVNSANVANLTYDADLSNRYTAYEVIAAFGTSYDLLVKNDVLLTENWDPALELDWTVQKGAGLADPKNFEFYTWVYRRWSIPNSVLQPSPKAPTHVYALIPFWDSNRYVPVDCYVDWASKSVVANVPIVTKGNPYVEGKAIGPSEVYLTYYAQKDFTSFYVPRIRVPETGYEGTAYTQYGLQRVKSEVVELSALTVQNATSKLALTKDVIITGTIPLDGDPVEELINMNRRVLVNHPSNVTGIQSIFAIYLNYRYQFGSRGRNEIGLTTDLSGLIKVR